MQAPSRRPFHALCCVALLAVFSVVSASAQTVEVTSGMENVVVDGNVVRIQGPTGTTVVDANWRETGAVTVSTPTDQILVDLGAVTVDDRIQLNLAGDILFGFDSAAVTAAAAETLAHVAQVIRDRAVGEVYVMGHTDSIGNDAYNQKLSRQRAASVMSYLNQSQGIPGSVMVGVGMGSTRPVAHNTSPDGSDNPEGRAQNRRVEFQIATREGVQVGPDVVITPGGVTVGDVAVTAAGVTVGGVGGVAVTPGGVSVGGEQVVSVSGDGTTVVKRGVKSPAQRSAQSCPAGSDCDLECRQGNCDMTCNTGAECDFSCSGGGCYYLCESGSECDTSCSGGRCEMDCAPGADCDFGCTGGNCSYQCAAGSDCDHSCTGGGCTCDGYGC